MTKKCCIPTCKVESDQPRGRELTFHTVPSEAKIREKWINILQNKCNIALRKYSYICCLHFEPECFYYSGLCQNRRLKKESYPTLFLDSGHESLDNNEDDYSDNYSEIVKTNIDVENEYTSDLPVEISSASSSVSEMNNSQHANENNIMTSKKCENNSAIHNNTKSILYMNVDSLNASEEVINIINSAKGRGNWSSSKKPSVTNEIVPQQERSEECYILVFSYEKA